MRHMIALALVVTVGCASSYVPRPTDNVRVIEAGRGGGNWNFARNGKQFGLGDLASETASVPAAAEQASSARSQQIAYMVLSIIGGIALGVALGMADYGKGLETTRNKAALGLALGSIPFLGVAIPLEYNSSTRALNAVNIYNDSLAGR